MANGWTPERRVRQSELIHTWRPWEQSTGPRSEAGKARVSRNAYRGAAWREVRDLTKATNAALREQLSVVEAWVG